RRRDPLRRREAERVPAADAEALDEAAAGRERREERDLLRGDRRDDRLEGVGRERRSQAAQPGDEPRQNGLLFGELVELVQVAEVEAEELADDGIRGAVERFDVHASLGTRDLHLAAVDD